MSMTQAIFIVEFEFGILSSGRAMSVQVCYNDQCWEVPVIPENRRSKVELNVALPGTVKFVFSGKDNNHDTIVDKDGRVIEDMFVKVQRIALDGFETDTIFLNQRLNLETESNGTITTSYIGFNGVMEICMTKPTIFGQVMAWRR